MAANYCLSVSVSLFFLFWLTCLSHYHHFGRREKQAMGRYRQARSCRGQRTKLGFELRLSYDNVSGFNHYIFLSLYSSVYPWHKIQFLGLHVSLICFVSYSFLEKQNQQNVTMEIHHRNWLLRLWSHDLTSASWTPRKAGVIQSWSEPGEQWCRSQSERKGQECQSLGVGQDRRVNSPSPTILFYATLKDWKTPTHIGEDGSPLFSLPIQMLISSRNTLTNTSRRYINKRKFPDHVGQCWMSDSMVIYECPRTVKYLKKNLSREFTFLANLLQSKRPGNSSM